MLKKLFVRVGLPAGFGLAANSAFAVGPDFSTLTAGVDFSTVGPALLSIAVLISGVYVIWKGAKLILGAVKSA